MSWGDPATRQTGDLITAAVWNQDVVVNTQWLHDNLREPYVLLQDQKVSGTGGGTFAAGDWRTRTLNVEVVDSGDICTLNNNQFTLPAGTYRIFASAPGWQVADHQVRLRNVTDGLTTLLGTVERAQDGSNNQTRSFLSGRFTLTAQKTFELQHRCGTTASTYGFGTGPNFGETNIFAMVEIWQEEAG